MEAVVSYLAENIDMLYIVILSILLGVEVIANVPAVLHTPLMSGANAIHGVVIIGAIIVMGKADPDNLTAFGLPCGNRGNPERSWGICGAGPDVGYV